MITAKEKSKLYYDRKTHPLELKVGDNICLLVSKPKKKFDDQYAGPHKVLEILGKGNVKINYQGKATTVHVNRLKRSQIGLNQNEKSNFRLKELKRIQFIKDT